MAAQPGSNGLDLNGRIRVVETQIEHLREANGRIEGEMGRQRDRWHAIGNVVNGFAEVERTVETLKQSTHDLQSEVRALRAAIDKLQGPGGAIEQLAQLAEDKRFKRRLLGWAAWLSGGIATLWAFAQAVWPYVKIPTKP